jgi:hypothetical protein
MEKIPKLSNTERQIAVVVMQDGREFGISLFFDRNQKGWFISITFGDFAINNIRLCTSGNLLYQWRNILQFGLVVQVEGNQEATFIDDFESERCKLYALNKQETLDYARVISGQATA